MRTPSPAIQQCLAQGREAYLRQDWAAALAFDTHALALANAAAAEDLFPLALCHRFVGLSHYRLGGPEALGQSRAHFLLALEFAQRADDTELRLVISNHLGATLRDLGHHDEAYDLFREALREAVGPDLVAVRARLLGNLGALLDELDQRASADDCYARYEELLERLDDPRRLANARGLAGRAALLRGDLEEAAWRFDDEMRWGEVLDERRRRCSALKHRAELAIARLERVPETDATEVERLTKVAEESFEAAWGESDPAGDGKVRIRIALRRAEFLRARGRVAEAHVVLSQVHPLAESQDHPVLTASVEQARAKVCADAGLHGEALWYLSRAAHRRVSVIKGLKSERVRAMAHAWLDEVRAMANELRDEAFRVPRGAGERAQFDELLAEISSTLGDDLRPVRAGLVEDPWRWHDRLRAQSLRRWEAILGEDFKRLHPDSRDDLVLADVTYHGAVDDLGRSAHLLAVTLERELRERVVAPLRTVARANRGEPPMRACLKRFQDQPSGPTLATLLDMIQLAAELPVRAYFEAALGPEAFEGLASIVTLVRAVPSVSGGRFDLVEARNAVAHGRPPIASLDRVAVDAIKRALTLDAPVVLKRLLKWQLTP